ncbi:hypothetical protein EVAR_94302_1 [Eumeta japonica]|uniref:Uncharacterized protein n=1 Tax=Eumeta variegata TaxID=151549 RepID=A0A4C1UFW2_EUMVA|nr:hypothetical protein EVAR_94302_1 [Eumeta japonica]
MWFLPKRPATHRWIWICERRWVAMISYSLLTLIHTFVPRKCYKDNKKNLLPFTDQGLISAVTAARSPGRPLVIDIDPPNSDTHTRARPVTTQ